MLTLLKLGYSIHDVLDEIAKLRVWSQDHRYAPEVVEAVRPLDVAGQHLARIMCELTKPED